MQPFGPPTLTRGTKPQVILSLGLLTDGGEDLVVSIGISRDVSAEVELALPALTLAAASALPMSGNAPIVSANQANLAVAQLKQHITDAIRLSQAKTVHLFIAGPAFLALLLGHRLNATAPVQCYEWVGTAAYVPTCRVN
jgi:hypothetical protein